MATLRWRRRLARTLSGLAAAALQRRTHSCKGVERFSVMRTFTAAPAASRAFTTSSSSSVTPFTSGVRPPW